MQTHYRASAILIAFLMVPFGVAIFQDAKAVDAPYGLNAYGGYDYGSLSDYDDDDYDYDAYDDDYDYGSDYDYDYDYDDDYEAGILAELAELRGYEEKTSMGASFFDDIFMDGGKAKGPILSGPFSGISFGQSEAQLVKLNPVFEDWSVELPGYEDAAASLDIEHDRLLSITVRFPDDGSALRSFTTQWGAATSEGDEYETTAIWTNKKNKLMAQLISSDWDGYASLTLQPYQELSEFIAPKNKLFGFEHTDLLALSKAETQALLMDSYGDEIILRQPNIANTGEAVEVIVTLDDAERVVSASVDLDLDAASSRELFKLVEKKMGAPATKTGDEWGKVYVFKKSSRVVTLKTDDEGWNSIIISRK